MNTHSTLAGVGFQAFKPSREPDIANMITSLAVNGAGEGTAT